LEDSLCGSVIFFDGGSVTYGGWEREEEGEETKLGFNFYFFIIYFLFFNNKR
jgi:hypothetical protein